MPKTRPETLAHENISNTMHVWLRMTTMRRVVPIPESAMFIAPT